MELHLQDLEAELAKYRIIELWYEGKVADVDRYHSTMEISPRSSSTAETLQETMAQFVADGGFIRQSNCSLEASSGVSSFDCEYYRKDCLEVHYGLVPDDKGKLNVSPGAILDIHEAVLRTQSPRCWIQEDECRSGEISLTAPSEHCT